jgi:hypothetical protein
MKLKNDSLATEWVDFMLKYVQRFRLSTDDRSWIVENKRLEAEKMAPGVQGVFGMYNWAEKALPPDYSKRLGRIWIDGSSVCWNISHNLYDGVSLSTLSTWFERGKSPAPQVFPDAADDALRDQIVGISDAEVQAISTRLRLRRRSCGAIPDSILARGPERVVRGCTFVHFDAVLQSEDE